MKLVEAVAQRRQRKLFSEPPFWALDRFRTMLLGPTLSDRERIEDNFEGYIQGIYKACGVVFACITARQAVFSQARFQWRTFSNGRPGTPFGTPELGLLEHPWPNGTSADLLARMEVEASIAGTSYVTIADNSGRLGRAATGPGRRLAHMRPDRVIIVIGSRSGDPLALDAQPVGYLYEPPIPLNGKPSGAVLLRPNEVSHYAPIPDPAARYRGMSWLTPVLREISADRAATQHKLKFFENGATLQAVASLPKEIGVAEFNEFVASFREQHEGVDNAYKTLFLGGGADVSLVGANLQQIDFKNTQGAGETRIAAAARVHPVILGLSEGLAGASLNAGNFGQARRNFVEGTLHWLWQSAAGSLQTLVDPPTSNTELWCDHRDIAFLREDRGDVAEIQQKKATTIRALVDAGFTPESVVVAVEAEDMSELEHSGLYSVQLQAPGSQQPALPPPIA